MLYQILPSGFENNWLYKKIMTDTLTDDGRRTNCGHKDSSRALFASVTYQVEAYYNLHHHCEDFIFAADIILIVPSLH
jgi:hypothetical protein